MTVSSLPSCAGRFLTIPLELGMRHVVLDEDGKLDPVLCPSFAYGFSLQRKNWCKFYIDCLEDISWKTSSMDSLILPDRQKRILTALVSSHEFPDEAREEAELKGKGLVILLHGSPGSGKTLTAGIGHLHIFSGVSTLTLFRKYG